MASQPNNDARVSTKERDFLEQDPPIRGQRFACVSFVSPDDVIDDKDAYILSRFVQSLGEEVASMLDSLDAKYGARSIDDRQTISMVRNRHAYLWSDAEMQAELRMFRSLRGSELDDTFHQMNKFQTSIRGFKIRGVYDSVEEATERAKAIKRFDDKFSVFISEVGCWCPFNPTPEAISNAEYGETELNTLMKAYVESQDKRDEIYEARKQSMMKQIANEKDEWLRMKQEGLAAKPDAEEPPAEPEAVAVAEPEQPTAGDASGPAEASDVGGAAPEP